MPLPAPHLDDRKFQDIVDETKRLIALRCPEWTDHNVSDPGVTLIELFAWMTEMSLYRLNQVPERNYVKFLEMLGVKLEAPHPAQTELRFLLSKPIDDADSDPNRQEVIIPAELIAGTVRTDMEESVEFLTEKTGRIVRPQLEAILQVPADGKPLDFPSGFSKAPPSEEEGKRSMNPTHKTQNPVLRYFRATPTT